MQKIKILIIESRSSQIIKLKNLLDLANYEVVGIARDSRTAIELVRSVTIDIIISDVYLNGEPNGISTISLIHKIKNIPTIFITSSHDDNILRELLKVDFAGYVARPCLEEQLLIELRFICIRNSLKQVGGEESIINLGNGYIFNQNHNKLYLHNKPIKLTKQELTLMQLLVQNIGNTLATEAVELILWHDKIANENSRRQLLFRLKSKINGLTIETIKGEGYKLHKNNKI